MAGVFPFDVVLVGVAMLDELATALLAGKVAELVGSVTLDDELAGLFLLLEEDSATGVSLEDDATISVRKIFSQSSLK